MQKISLPALQKQFRDVLKLRDAKLRPVVKLINVNRKFSREERLDVYQYAYLSRLVESMQEDFPLVQDLLGEKNFILVVEKYLAKHPSRYWTLAELGSRFPDYLGGAEAKKLLSLNKKTAKLKNDFLRDLARLELARIIAFLSEAPQLFNFATLGTLQPEVLLASRLRLNPSLKIVKSRWPIGADFSTPKALRVALRSSAEPIIFAVYRSESGVQTYRVPEAFAGVFMALHRGTAISRVLESVLKRKIEASAVFDVFAQWTSLGLVTGFELQK